MADIWGKLEDCDGDEVVSTLQLDGFRRELELALVG